MTNEQFRLIRLYLGITQREYAKLIGIPKPTVSKIEAGYTIVTEKNKAKVIRKFDPEKDEFIEFRRRMKV
ncbi:helix-turn-helix domain-containing protein [Salimicrobium flavidum]|uniref:Helix-turn-helix n=1 Tax=Salimicrobium flavidum TaxID=570947 RepID=A0A1N7JXR5_9BACI|nr:helix-turn-helix transcriptional regulator [Salimicrobium flavidum]SIS54117.1 Helix-turn-helix [Salimicrobium flavidum]